MTSTTETTLFERQIEIAASPETVWSLLTDPEKARTWWGHSLDLDARPGAPYRFEIIPGHTARGEFVEVDPPRRLVYTWGWEAGPEGLTDVPPGSTTVEIDLVPDGEGTLLRLTHRHLPTAESAARHAEGWDHYLGRLAVAASGGDPGPDPWASPAEA
jgi:uncharacterized protein YndB with AHSA1/START domain